MPDRSGLVSPSSRAPPPPLPRLLPLSCLGAAQTIISKGGGREEGKGGRERGKERKDLSYSLRAEHIKQLELALVKLMAISSSVIKQIVVCQESWLVEAGGVPCACLSHRLGMFVEGAQSKKMMHWQKLASSEGLPALISFGVKPFDPVKNVHRLYLG